MERLLRKYLRGDVSVDEKRQVQEWLDQSPEHMQEYYNARKLYTLLLWNTDKNKNSKRRTGTIRSILFDILKIASILFIGFALGYYLFDQEKESVKMIEVNVPAGQRTELLLSDGTTVWLNSRTTLVFPDRFEKGNRSVRLDGEGYFVVKSDSNRPFIVQTEEYDVRAVGTEFNVKAYTGKSLFETSLIQGEVLVYSQNLASETLLSPGQMVYKNKDVLVSKTISDYNYFKWKEGIFCFENESMTSLIEKLQLYYDVTIKNQAEFLPDYCFSGKLRINDGIEHALRVLQLKYKFSYIKNDELNLIVIK